jgi:uncharacterized protein YdhG (YjbR/CyaY superfamily)
MPRTANERICPQGHRYVKSSDCPTCPKCETMKAKADWMAGLSAPARRALEGAGLTTPKLLARKTEAEVLALHGMGPTSIPKLRNALQEAGLSFAGIGSRKPAPQGLKEVDAYLAGLSPEQRKALEQVRRLILSVPGMEEHFGYGMPAFKYRGHPVLYIGAAKAHCGLYGSVPVVLRERLKDLAVSKGTVRFTPDKPLSADLVKDIVKLKMAEIDLRWPMGPKKGAATKSGSRRTAGTGTKRK